MAAAAVVRALVALVACVSGVGSVGASMGTTTDSAATYSYDVLALARADAHDLVSAEANLTTSSEVAAPCSANAQATSTTRVHAFQATNFVQSSPSSRVLGETMGSAGLARPAESAAHHLVAGGAGGAADARAVLTRFGIDINAAENGVFLPRNLASANPIGAAVHSTIHTDAYYAGANRLLGQATTRAEALDALDYVRQQLQSGGFP